MRIKRLLNKFQRKKSVDVDPKRATYPPTQPRRLVLPPIQVKRTLNPNSNYYRKVSADYHRREALRKANKRVSPIHRRLSMLEDIKEEGEKRKNKTGTTTEYQNILS